ncbi:hypothetical protein N7492_002904 [Penicillium capsulatum]|uniref:F-box domain-containing protein n=1 Tax=Penicillium capsulatum TaxID=69766 RepID=A0A9W9LWG2_9EURO|nr:hypothetical protein N7492_002904 [Penicillium capsulatum]KAJ6122502.1 hypothetical protein N7512_004967 [Penicillium capsulatum]
MSSEVATTGESLLTRLPESIRHKIYDLLGLKPYITDPIRREISGKQLFLVSQKVSRDARAFYFSQNVIWKQDSGKMGFPILRDFTSVALSSFRCLTLHIGPRDFQRMSTEDILRDDPLLFDGFPRLLEDWKAFCRRLAVHTEPNRLELRIYTFASSRRSVEEILNPLLPLPRLWKFLVRLKAVEHDDSLQSYVEEVGQKLTAPKHGSFRFNDLPREIQIKILELTGLINPLCCLEWCPKRRVFGDFYCKNGVCRNEAWNHQDCELSRICFSSSRNCWKMPKPLFQASASLRGLAEYVFYTRNAFRVRIPRPLR